MFVKPPRSTLLLAAPKSSSRASCQPWLRLGVAWLLARPAPPWPHCLRGRNRSGACSGDAGDSIDYTRKEARGMVQTGQASRPGARHKSGEDSQGPDKPIVRDGVRAGGGPGVASHRFRRPDARQISRRSEPRLQRAGAIPARDGFATSEPGVFVAGDAKRGASLIVWAIAEGRKAAR